MLNHRDKGYATLHKLILLSSVFIWFWISLDLWDSMDYSLINLPWNYALVALAGLAVATFGSLQQYGAFFMKNGWERIRESLIKANFQTALIAFFVFASYFATKDNETSRLFLLFYISTSWPILASFNFALPGLFKRLIGFQVINRKSLIIGDSMSLDSLRKWIKRHTEQGFSFEGMFTTDKKEPLFTQIPWLGSFENLEKYLSESKIHQLILLPNSNMEKWIRIVSDLGAKHGCRILVYNNLSGYFDSRLVFVEESGRQFFSLQNEPLESPFNQMVKRSFDLLMSVPALLFVLPPCMLMVIWKFRSMTFAKDGERDESEQAHPGDERIFAFGTFIRRFSIDEIPQFINVFSGEMSLVGPRPYLAKHDFLFERDYKAYRIRQFVKPGITGPAQCRGLRGEFTDPELLQKRIELDFNYVGNWTIWLDCEIVLRTIIQVLFPPKSAY